MLQTLAEQIKEFGKYIRTITTRTNHIVETYEMDEETFSIIVYSPFNKIIEVRYLQK